MKENCWFFCSLIQEKLDTTGHGIFEAGYPLHNKLALTARRRVDQQLGTAVPGVMLTPATGSKLVLSFDLGEYHSAVAFNYVLKGSSR